MHDRPAPTTEDNEPGTPFPELMSDPRDAGQREQERAEVDKQVRHLTTLQTDPDYVAEYVAELQERRGPDDPVQLEPVGEDGRPPYVAAARLLVDPSALDRGGRQDLADRFGLAPVTERADAATAVGRGRDTGLVVLVPIDPSGATRRAGRAGRAGDTLAMQRTLQDAGYDVSLDYVVPLGPVMKGEGGPEPSPALDRRRPDVPAEGPTIAVIDTGISREVRADGYLRDLLRADNVDELDEFPPPRDYFLDAGAGHGAFVAGVVQQVWPAAALDIRKAYDADGVATVSRVADEMVDAVRNGAKIVNLSLGTATRDDVAPPAFLDAVRRIAAIDGEALVVVAAGNGADDTPMWPAALAGMDGVDNVVAVAGLDPDRNPSSWSTRGKWVTCSAIGEGVVSTYVIGMEDGDLIHDKDPDTFRRNSWATWTGSSFAAPQIAAGIARICASTGGSPREALAQLLDGAPQLPEWGRCVGILHGTGS